MTSPYASFADTLRDNGYHVMPCTPGAKVPGTWDSGSWRPMPQWQKWCDTMPPEFLHQRWLAWPDAGLCVAHGAIVGLDIDTDRKDVAEAAVAAVGPSPIRRTGAKGWMGYYRPGAGLGGHTARVRWFDGDGAICVELLLHGTQSVIPPTIHPGTGASYRWITPDSMDDVAARELPELPRDAVKRLDAAFAAIGLTRQAPRKVNGSEYERPAPTAHDLEKPLGRSVNDRAMAPGAIDLWWPALNLPKSRQRGRSGSWEAVPFWRGSGSGRALQDRNPNLKATPGGIVDFGADRSYTPVDVIMAARDCSFMAAVEWLTDFVRPEDIADFSGLTAPAAHEAPSEAEENFASEPVRAAPMKSPLGKFLDRGNGRRIPPKTVLPSSDMEFDAEFPHAVPPFPVRDFERDLTGTLRDLTIHIDAASRMRSEQGAFGAALALLATILGGKVEFHDGTDSLRTNMYIVGTASSGAGKSSAMNAMKKVAAENGVSEVMAGSDFTSDAAILSELRNTTPKIFCIDEFGDVVRRILGAKSASHEQGIRRVLKDLYSASASTYHGKSYASVERTDIIEPHMCIYGASTYEAFWQGINGESFKDGFIARFVVIPIGETEVSTPCSVRHDAVAEGIKAICQSTAGRGNLAAWVAKRAQVSDEVLTRYRWQWSMNHRHSKRAEKRDMPGAGSIIMRISENAMKIALVSAAARDIDNLEITHEDYDMGYAVAHWSAISMISAIEKYYVESEAHRNVKRIVEIVKSCGQMQIGKSDLTRRTQGMSGRDRDDAIKTALESGQISAREETPGASGGRIKIWYYTKEY